jgi:hypothetical protein
MKLMKYLTLNQQNAKRDEMQFFHSMNYNYIREKVSFSRIQQVTKEQFLQSLNDIDSKQSKLLNFPN